jgi:hypothetical protein
VTEGGIGVSKRVINGYVETITVGKGPRGDPDIGSCGV